MAEKAKNSQQQNLGYYIIFYNISIHFVTLPIRLYYSPVDHTILYDTFVDIT